MRAGRGRETGAGGRPGSLAMAQMVTPGTDVIVMPRVAILNAADRVRLRFSEPFFERPS